VHDFTVRLCSAPMLLRYFFNDIHIIPHILNLPSVVLTFHTILLVLGFFMFMRALVLSKFSYIITYLTWRSSAYAFHTTNAFD
jgi:hypothetical protein